MAKTSTEILEQIALLERQAAAMRQKEVAEVIKSVKSTIATYGLTAADLGLGRVSAKGAVGAKRGKKAASKLAAGAKYQDGAGNVWGGRGPRPRWLRAALESGRALEDFRA